jgi:hypothetical protein
MLQAHYGQDAKMVASSGGLPGPRRRYFSIDENWYPGYQPTLTQNAQGEVRYDSAYYLEDSR